MSTSKSIQISVELRETAPPVGELRLVQEVGPGFGFQGWMELLNAFENVIAQTSNERR